MYTFGFASFGDKETPNEEGKEGEEDEKHVLEGFGILVFLEELL